VSIKGFLRNLFTGDNNQDFSYVRIMGAMGFIMIVFMVTIGVPLWTLIAIHYHVDNLPSLSDWSAYYAGASALVGTTFAGLAGLLWANEKPKPMPENSESQ